VEVFLLTAVQRDEAVAYADIDIELIRSIVHPMESQFVLSDWKVSRLVKYTTSIFAHAESMFDNVRVAIQPLAVYPLSSWLRTKPLLFPGKRARWILLEIRRIPQKNDTQTLRAACELSPPMVVFFFYQSPEQWVD